MRPPHRLPLVSTVAHTAFVVRVLVGLLAGALLYPGGGPRLTYWIAPDGLAMAALGGLALTNYRRTADAIGGWRQVLRRRPQRHPAPSTTIDRAIGGFFVAFGLFIAIGGPVLA